MTEAVRLDPGSYKGQYKLIGGALALDFANLVSYRGTEREHDWLEPPSNLRAWADATGVPLGALPAIQGVRQLREVVARVFLAIADKAGPDGDDISAISRMAVRGWAHRELQFASGAVVAKWVDRAPSVLTAVGLDAAALLTSSEAIGRISACSGCRWLFLDISRNRSRSWCDPADCGNRARQRRHYRRHRPD